LVELLLGLVVLNQVRVLFEERVEFVLVFDDVRRFAIRASEELDKLALNIGKIRGDHIFLIPLRRKRRTHVLHIKFPANLPLLEHVLCQTLINLVLKVLRLLEQFDLLLDLLSRHRLDLL
jgi:hypothetical protein